MRIELQAVAYDLEFCSYPLSYTGSNKLLRFVHEAPINRICGWYYKLYNESLWC